MSIDTSGNKYYHCNDHPIQAAKLLIHMDSPPSERGNLAKTSSLALAAKYLSQHMLNFTLK